MTELIIPIIIMLIVVIAEAIFLSATKKRQVNWRDIIFNLNSGHIILWLFRGLELFCFNYIYTHFSFDLFSYLPEFAVWIFTLLVWNFGFYWLHRLHHKVPLLWGVHAIHHQGEYYNLSLVVRNSWYSSLTAIPFFALLALLGVPTNVFVTISIFHYTIQFINHSALLPKLGWIEYIFVTPTHHRVHHIKDPYFSMRNFAGSFIIWDKLFGSFEAVTDQHQREYGVGNMPNPQNPFWASNLPFIRYFKLPFRPSQNKATYQLNVSHIIFSSLLLFVLVLGYIYTYGYGYHNVTGAQYVLFTWLALGTIAIGGLSEGRNWGMVLWFVLTLSAPLLFLWWFDWSQLYWRLPIIALTLYGSGLFLFWLPKCAFRSSM